MEKNVTASITKNDVGRKTVLQLYVKQMIFTAQ